MNGIRSVLRETAWAPGRISLTVLLLGFAVPVASGEVTMVTPGWETSGWVSRGEPVEIVLHRAVRPEEGRLAVVIGATEVTEVLRPTPRGLTFIAGTLPLPAGEQQLKVFLVTPTGEWQEQASFPLRIRTRAGFEQAQVRPSLDLSAKGQVAEGHRPPENAPPRSTYQDFTMQAGVRTLHTRGDFALRSSIAVVGASRQEEALRFRQRGEDAPRVDLASYLVQMEMGGFSVSLGHVNLNTQRHLLQGLSSRGTTVSYRFSPALSLRAVAVAGATTVGWSNPFGLANRDHSIFAGTLALEALPSRPGAFRLEATLLDGSVVPAPGFNQGAVLSADESDGAALRLVASDASGRLNLDAGYARVTSRSGRDPELESGLDVTPLDETTRSARYLDASYTVIQGLALGEENSLDVTLAARHEQVAPLFRSVGAFTAADRRHNVVDLTASTGPASFHVSVSESDDNLDRIPSVLTTDTRRYSANLALTLSALLGGGAGWPVVTLLHDRTHQSGRGVPEDDEFEPSHVPDQVSRNTSAGLQWQGDGWSLGYERSLTDQDNRQPGRELADFETRVDTVNASFAVSSRLDLGVDLSQERMTAFELGRTDRIRRWGVNANWRMTERMSVLSNAARTWSRDNLEQGRSTGVDFDAQWSVSFNLPAMGLGPARGSLFARYANRRLDALDRVFGFAEANRQWTVNTGLNLSFFAR